MNRRNFLNRTLGGSSLLAVGSVVPEFLARTAVAAEETRKPKEAVLVIIEMTGGNDGLNTVAPYADDLYHKNRPTLGFRKKQVHALDDYHGLHLRMNRLKEMYDRKHLAVVQGVGYPNPDRSHFESMDIWQLADPRRSQTSGWLARAIPSLPASEAVPGMFLGDNRLPVAMQGTDGGVISLRDRQSFKLQLTGPAQPARKTLLEELNTQKGPAADLAAFVRKRQLQTYTSLQRIEEALNEAQKVDNPNRVNLNEENLNSRLNLISRLIQKGLGTRIYYVTHEGFDTHSRQAEEHGNLLGNLSDAIFNFYETLKGKDNDDRRVVVMTYSEFGRRVKENGSRGTDHGAASCMFVAGPGVQGGLVGKHPKLDDLTDGDLKYHTDFRRVYASLLDNWLGIDSIAVLGSKFEPLPLIQARA